MKIVVISYADQNFRAEQIRFSKSVKKINKNYIVLEYEPKDIDENFRNEHNNILNNKKGGGYWLWKPYIINNTLKKLKDGDYLFYCDSGVILVNKIELLIKDLDRENQDIMGFELPLIESQWTKKETLVNLNCYDKIFYESNQILASFILIKNTNRSRKFIEGFLRLCCVKDNIIDATKPLNNQLDDFIDHRHDQSIFSLMYKQSGYKAYRDPSQYGYKPEGYIGLSYFRYNLNETYVLESGRKFRVNDHINSLYPMILLHTRNEKLFKFHINNIRKIIMRNVKRFLEISVLGRKEKVPWKPPKN